VTAINTGSTAFKTVCYETNV